MRIAGTVVLVVALCVALSGAQQLGETSMPPNGTFPATTAPMEKGSKWGLVVVCVCSGVLVIAGSFYAWQEISSCCKSETDVEHGHSHGAQKDKNDMGEHGHSHDGQEKKEKKDKEHGHSHDIKDKKDKKDKENGHSHEGKEKKEKDHGHSHDGKEKKDKKDKEHGHSHEGKEKKKEKSDKPPEKRALLGGVRGIDAYTDDSEEEGDHGHDHAHDHGHSHV